MNRSKYVAALLALGVVGALAATRLGNDDQAGPVGDEAPAVVVDSAAATTPPVGEDSGDPATDEAPDATGVTDPPPILDPKPELRDLDGWLQTDATSLADFDGQVRIVEFWTFGCFNCKNRLPYTQALYEEFHPQGLEVIGVHAPEFDFESDPERIAQAAIDLGVVWPIALDTNKTNFRAWQGSRRFWPRVYVLDQNGQVRYDHIGEGDYDGLEDVVSHLIENGP